MIKAVWNYFYREREIKRQLIHMVFGLAYGAAFYFEFLPIWLAWCAVVGVLLVSLILRRRHRITDDLLRLAEREEDIFRFPLKGAFFCVLGLALTITLFEPLPALAGIIALAAIDSLGTLYGKYLGVVEVPWNKKKHFEGAILGGLLLVAICVNFLPWGVAVAAALVGVFLDTIDLQLDDNIYIPLVVAAVVEILI